MRAMRSLVLGCLLAVWAPVGAVAQTPAPVPPPPPATVEAWAKLPPERQVYERFRYWASFQPGGQRDDPALLDHYRAALVAAGTSAADADAAIATIRTHGRRLEVERWNTILTAEQPRFNTKPNAFLVQIVRGRTPGTALDVGMGQGRNAIYLAQQGWRVTGFDPAERAVALAQQTAAKAGVTLTTHVQTDDEFDWGENRWDLILLSYVRVRENVDRVLRALRPGGLVVVEATHRDATKTRSVGGAIVFDSNELPRLFGALRLRHYEDTLVESDFGREVAPTLRLAAEKP